MDVSQNRRKERKLIMNLQHHPGKKREWDFMLTEKQI